MPQKVGSILTRDARVARSARFNYRFLVSRAVAELDQTTEHSGSQLSTWQTIVSAG